MIKRNSGPSSKCREELGALLVQLKRIEEGAIHRRRLAWKVSIYRMRDKYKVSCFKRCIREYKTDALMRKSDFYWSFPFI